MQPTTPMLAPLDAGDAPSLYDQGSDLFRRISVWPLLTSLLALLTLPSADVPKCLLSSHELPISHG